MRGNNQAMRETVLWGCVNKKKKERKSIADKQNQSGGVTPGLQVQSRGVGGEFDQLRSR